VASNLRASRAIVALGRRLDSTGEFAPVAEFRRMMISQGSIPPNDVRRLSAELARASVSLKVLATQLHNADRPYLVPDISEAVRLLNARLLRVAASVDQAIDELGKQVADGH
jgi:hypothetical protein